MKNIETGIINSPKNEDEKLEGSLDEIVNWEFVENFAETFEELGAINDLEIPEKPSAKLQEKFAAIADFFKRNNGENAKLIAFGAAVALGKSAADIIVAADTFDLYKIEDLKSLIKEYAETSDLLRENLFIGAGSAVIQKSIEETRRTLENNGPKIKEGLKRIIEISRKTLTHEPTNT